MSAVIVTYNSSQVIGFGLNALERAWEAGQLHSCIVVDNASRDGTAALVRREHPWCAVVEPGDNLGFGRGCNLGIACSRAPYVLLLNPDASIEPDALARLVRFLDRNPRAGAVAPAIRQPDGRMQHAGGIPTPATFLWSALGRPKPDAEARTIAEGAAAFRTAWLCGAVVLVRREMLDEIGAFDPRFFLYFEETDLWLRAQRAGWELWALGEALATHVQGASARTVGAVLHQGCIPEHFFRSRYYYLRKHYGWAAAATTEVCELVFLAARAFMRRIRGKDAGPLVERLQAPVFG